MDSFSFKYFKEKRFPFGFCYLLANKQLLAGDGFLISVTVKALNQARLEANIRMNGEEKHQKRLPSPYAIACGLLLLLSFLKYVYHPLEYLALGAVLAGALPVVLKAIASIRNLRLDINILMIIAGISVFTFAFKYYLLITSVKRTI